MFCQHRSHEFIAGLLWVERPYGERGRIEVSVVFIISCTAFMLPPQLFTNHEVARDTDRRRQPQQAAIVTTGLSVPSLPCRKLTHREIGKEDVPNQSGSKA